MRYLLDTNIFLWWSARADNLSAPVAAILRERTTELYLSLASVWEIQIKVQLGKLPLRMPLAQLIAEQVETNGFTLLPVIVEHVYRLDQLPLYHRDPFDRILVAQAMVEHMTMLSSDSLLAQYAITVIG
jgi:PIN domain nuclease of toxin-antitoxin system